jgi:Domain of unknown function (DUF397)
MYSEGTEPSELKWRKSRRSLTNGECVEVAHAEGWVAVRDSKNPDGVMLTYSTDAWSSFISMTRPVSQGRI